MTQTKKPIEYVSREMGDIVIAVGNKEYPIDYVEGEELIFQEYGAGSHDPYSISCRVIGSIKLGLYLNAEKIMELTYDIEYPNPFTIRIKNVRKYTNCKKGAVRPHENIFEFDGCC